MRTRTIRILAMFVIALAVSATGMTGAQRGSTSSLKANGIHQYNRGDFAAAARYFSEALKSDPNDGESCYYLARIFEKLGQTARAAQYDTCARAKGFLAPGSPAKQPTLGPATANPDAAKVSEPVSPLGPVRNKWALIIGIGTFADKEIRTLKYTAKDARDLARVLADPNSGRFPADHVRLLVDQDATTVAIRQGINWLTEVAGEGDLVLIYLSTHGSPAEADLALRPDGFFVTYDTSSADLYPTAFSMRDFARDVNERIRARRKVILLDTCFSGQAGERSLVLDAGKPQNDIAGQLSGYGSVVITSSGPDERSYESDKIKNGYFTYYIIQALEGKNDLSIADLYRQLEANVPRAVLAGTRARQRPRIHVEKGTDISLIRIGAVASP